MMIAFLDSFLMLAIVLAVLAPLPFIMKRALPKAALQQPLSHD
jgi:hypothetical protein